ncbi:acetyltransferase [Aerococcus urinaeequi]|uniref:acetyltransferase n=1 Tax=Aerococcus urinaeequi TaxID=51665 RepID=UPI003D6A2A7B
MSAQLIIIGAGGHAKVCYEIAEFMNQWSEITILDDKSENDFFKISGPISTFTDYPDADFFVAIGSNDVRRRFYEMIIEKQYNLATLIHPSSTISKSTEIGYGTVIMPGVIVNSNTVVGNGVILNTAVTVDHDNIINDYVHISPGSHLAGNVVVGEESWIGMGTNIINNIGIKKDIIVGSSSNVVDNLSDPGLYYGNPAKFRKERQV